MEAFLGTMAGAIVGMFLFSILVAWIMKLFIRGQSQWQRMRFAVPTMLGIGLTLSYFSTRGSEFTESEWPVMAFCYGMAAILWFIVALIVVANENTKRGVDNPSDEVT